MLMNKVMLILISMNLIVQYLKMVLIKRLFKIILLAEGLLRKLLDKNPATRITASSALQHPWLIEEA